MLSMDVQTGLMWGFVLILAAEPVGFIDHVVLFAPQPNLDCEYFCSSVVAIGSV